MLHNPVNVYMTHMTNYANDRLALYTFSALFDFVQTHTNLQLKYAASGRAQPATTTTTTNDQNYQLGPASLANYYFNLYPNEQNPLWTVSSTDWLSAYVAVYC